MVSPLGQDLSGMNNSVFPSHLNDPRVGGSMIKFSSTELDFIGLEKVRESNDPPGTDCRPGCGENLIKLGEAR